MGNKIDCSVRFLHASDIHLGNQQYRNIYRADDFIRAFQEILDLALKYQVDFILLGGDIFTSLDLLPDQLTQIIKILKNFKINTDGRIPIIVIEGNHDLRKYSRGLKITRHQSWLKLIANLDLFILLDADINASPEDMYNTYNLKLRKGGKIQIKNVVIYGNRYLGSKTQEFLPKIRKAIKINDGLFHILLQHFGIEGQMKNVPGLHLQIVEQLKDRVDYLALGHYHKQFILNEWIYNPGSSEAACSSDSSYKRGIFLVKIFGNNSYTKQVYPIQLTNRKHIWHTLIFPVQFRNKSDINKYVIQKLKLLLNSLRSDLKPSNPQMPILYLVLKSKKPFNSCKIDERSLKKMIIENFPVVDVKIYQKLENSVNTIDKYL